MHSLMPSSSGCTAEPKQTGENFRETVETRIAMASCLVEGSASFRKKVIGDLVVYSGKLLDALLRDNTVLFAC